MKSIIAKRHACEGMMLFLVFFSTVALSFTLVSKAQASNWPPPSQFFQVEEGGSVQSPSLVTDSAGNLYALWGAAMSEGQPMALYYSRWKDGKWTDPIDALMSPDGGNMWPFSLYMTSDDYLHVFWGSGGKLLWHSVAHATRLGDVRGWAKPDMVPVNDQAFTTQGVYQDALNRWYLVYSNRSLDTIRILVSTDDASTWPTELVVYQENRPDTWVGYPDIVVTSDDALWVSWQEMESGTGKSKGLAYSRSTDGGQTWSEPQQLIEGYYFGGFQVVDGTMVKKIAGGIGTGGRYISFSKDQGATWSDSQNISAGGGEGAQAIGLVVDSAGVWHFIVETGQTFARVAWDGRTWAAPEFIVSREELQACCVAPEEVTENASAAISDGNRMHVFFEQDDRTLWYTTKVLDAPAAGVRPAKAPLSTGDRLLAGTQTVVPVIPTPDTLSSSSTSIARDSASALPIKPVQAQAGLDTFQVVLVGMLPAAVLVIAVVLISMTRSRKL